MRILTTAAVMLGAWMGSAHAQAPAPPPLTPPPEGRLQLVSGNDVAATFLDLERIERRGAHVEFWILQIPAQPYALTSNALRADWVVQTVQRGSIDCGARLHTHLSLESFNAAGERVVWLPRFPAEPIEARSAHDFVAGVLCDGVELPASNIVIGHAVAREITRQIFADTAASRSREPLQAEP